MLPPSKRKAARSRRVSTWEHGKGNAASGKVPINRDILFTSQAKEIMTKNPGLVQFFLSRRNLKERESAGLRGFALTKLGKKEYGGTTASNLYVLLAGKQQFFVKEYTKGVTGEKFDPTLDLPVQQAFALREAKRILSSLKGFSDFEVVEPLVAFNGKESAYLVMPFVEGEPLMHADARLRSPIFFARLEVLREKMKKNHIYDVLSQNIIFDFKRRKYVLVDLRFDSQSSMLD